MILRNCNRLTALVLASFQAMALVPSHETGFLRKDSFEARPALVLSNDRLELTLLTQGGSFADLTLRDDPERLSPLWNPIRMAREAGRTPPGPDRPFRLRRRLRPGVAGRAGAGLPGHGEAHAAWGTRASERAGRSPP